MQHAAAQRERTRYAESAAGDGPIAGKEPQKLRPRHGGRAGGKDVGRAEASVRADERKEARAVVCERHELSEFVCGCIPLRWRQRRDSRPSSSGRARKDVHLTVQRGTVITRRADERDKCGARCELQRRRIAEKVARLAIRSGREDSRSYPTRRGAGVAAGRSDKDIRLARISQSVSARSARGESDDAAADARERCALPADAAIVGDELHDAAANVDRCERARDAGIISLRASINAATAYDEKEEYT